MTDAGGEEPDGAPAAEVTGVGVSTGIAIGPARVVESGLLTIPEYTLEDDEAVSDALKKLDKALARSTKQLRALQSKVTSLPGAAGEEMSLLLEAHEAMLKDSRLVRGVRQRVTEQRLNVEAAVRAESSEIARGFEALEDPYIAARAADVRDVGGRLLRNLMEGMAPSFRDFPPNTILIAEEITPADTAQMDPARIAGFAAMIGGAEGHAAIMARSLGLPAVLGAAGLLTQVRNGDLLILDGTNGRIFVNPSPGIVQRYEQRIRALEKEAAKLARLRDVPSVTRDGTEIQLMSNIEFPRDVDQALNAGSSGVGLFRTEFMFMNRDGPPDEEEQYQVLRDVVERMQGRPVTIRTLDIGGEKLAYGLGDQVGDGLTEAVNPALGVRAIRLSLREPKLFETQLGAILRAAAHGPVRLLLPMITTTGEVRQVREILDRLWIRLKKRGATLPEKMPPVGVMIEIPGAALAADALANVADFFAIGSNDLTMYTLAIDRADEQVAALYNPLHPAVLRLIEFSVQAALRARLPISICGEIAGDTRFTPLLIGLGVRELSMSSTALPRVKQRVRKLDFSSATARARMVMEVTDMGRVATLLDDMEGLM